MSTSSKSLDWKVHLFMAGSAVVLAGVYFDNPWVMWGALALLVAAFGVRFLPRSEALSDEDTDGGSDQDSGGD